MPVMSLVGKSLAKLESSLMATWLPDSKVPDSSTGRGGPGWGRKHAAETESEDGASQGPKHGRPDWNVPGEWQS
jgi:hypothetical protein